MVHRTEQEMLLLGCGRGGSAGRLAVDHPQDERRTCITVPRTQDTISKSNDDKVDSESCKVVFEFARYIEISQSSVVMPGERQTIRHHIKTDKCENLPQEYPPRVYV